MDQAEKNRKGKQRDGRVSAWHARCDGRKVEIYGLGDSSKFCNKVNSGGNM
jgi:hypothetical protein